MIGDVTESRIEQLGPPEASEFIYVDIGSVDHESKRIVDPRRLDASEAPSRARQRLRAGDVLVSMTRPNLNAIAMVPRSLDGSIGSTGFHVLRAKADVLPEWLYYGVQTREFIRAMSDKVQGALYPAVRPRDVQAFQMSVPPRKEQRRIVAKIEKQFSRLDEGVAALASVQLRLRKYVDAVLGSVAPKVGGDLPCGWRSTAIGEVASVRGGKRLPAGHAYAEEPTTYAYLRVLDFRDFTVDAASLKYLHADTRALISRYTISKDDVYISIAGTVGVVGQVPEHLDGANLTENAAKITGLQGVLPKYLVYWLASPAGRELIAEATIATTQAKLALFRIEKLPVPLPPLAEQNRIVAEVDRRLSIVREVEAEVDANLKRAQALRQAILAKAFAPPHV